MAMLAEPRRKQKVINLRAKNNAWSNDNTKFGQRMLEKMGWTSGKGLGANENGITEHVVARYKNDEKGLGFEDNNDQWTKHEDDFNTLLANLSNASDNTENLHSGISLVDKSKKSKARIHYHKFTHGKDISRYSEKDLANIFGKKSLKNTEESPEPLKEDVKTKQQIFTEKGSMEDYFKNKVAVLKSKRLNKVPTVNENNPEDYEPAYGFCGSSQENEITEFCSAIEYNKKKRSNTKNTSVNYKTCDLENFKKKKKNSKMSKSNNDISRNVNQNSDNINYEQHQIYQNEVCIEEKIKKKKEKNKINVDVDSKEEVCQTQESITEKNKKKKSKHKHNLNDNNGEEQSHDYVNGHEISIMSTNTDQILKHKKKSKKNMNNSFATNTQINNVSDAELSQAQLNHNMKKKSSKNEKLFEENFVLQDTKKKKKSKRKNDHEADDVTYNTDFLPLPKKKKKKSKENKCT